jgi:hypothetical protein
MPLPDEPPDTGRGKLSAIFVIVMLLAAGLWLVHRLGATAALQDCISSGRSNCGQNDPAPR